MLWSSEASTCCWSSGVFISWRIFFDGSRHYRAAPLLKASFHTDYRWGLVLARRLLTLRNGRLWSTVLLVTCSGSDTVITCGRFRQWLRRCIQHAHTLGFITLNNFTWKRENRTELLLNRSLCQTFHVILLHTYASKPLKMLEKAVWVWTEKY